jgi:hypothetical protein
MYDFSEPSSNILFDEFGEVFDVLFGGILSYLTGHLTVGIS